MTAGMIAYLESLVLQDPLDSSIFAARRQFCLEDNTETAISNDLALGVGQIPRFACNSVLDSFSNDFC
jgi:hypothetical protein